MSKAIELLNLNSVGPGTTITCGRRRATVGALVNRGGKPHALTVAHVFCTGPTGKIALASGVGLGHLAACVPLRRLGVHSGDGALVALDRAVTLAPDHPLVGPLWGHLSEIPSGLSALFQGSAGPTRGQVIQSAWGGRVRYPWGSRYLCQQLLIGIKEGPRPRRGDSGSLWVTENGLAIGIQVAVTGGFAVVSPLGPLLKLWEARLLRSNGAAPPASELPQLAGGIKDAP